MSDEHLAEEGERQRAREKLTAKKERKIPESLSLYKNGRALEGGRSSVRATIKNKTFKAKN